MLSLLVIGLDNTVLNVALPTLVRSLHATETQLQWMVDAYILLFAALLLTMGSLGDRFGRRWALQIGLAVFGTGSLLSAFAGSPTLLILTRAFMGVGAAAIMPSTLSILINVFPEKERSRAIGIRAGFSVISIAVGPILGGWLVEHFWWGSVFLVNLPVVAVALVAGGLIVPNSRDPEAPPLDPVGAVLSAVGLVFLVYGIIEVPTKGWGSGPILGSMSLGIVVLVAFARWELRAEHPMLDLRFFRNPSFSGANVTITLAFFAMSSALFLLTQYLQFVLGYTPPQTGVRLLPLIATFVVAPISGPPGGAGRQQGPGRRRHGGRRRRALGLLADHVGVDLRAHGAQSGRPGHRALHGDRARDEHGDGLAPPREGRRRIGDERHDASGGWGVRRGRAREHPDRVVPLLDRVGARGTALGGGRHGQELDRRGARRRAAGRRPRRRLDRRHGEGLVRHRDGAQRRGRSRLPDGPGGDRTTWKCACSPAR